MNQKQGAMARGSLTDYMNMPMSNAQTTAIKHHHYEDGPTAIASSESPLLEQLETTMYLLNRIGGLTNQIHATLFGGQPCDDGKEPPFQSAIDLARYSRHKAEDIEKNLIRILEKIKGDM